MGFACFPDPAEFARRARPLLDADPVRHNVALGILSSLRDHPGRYASFALWAVEDAAGPAAAALHTPPFSAVLVKPRDDAGLIALAEGMHGAGVELPGVGGARPEVDLFAGIWAGLAGTQAVPHMSLRIHALDRVEPVPEAARAWPPTLQGWCCGSAAANRSARPALRGPRSRRPGWGRCTRRRGTGARAMRRRWWPS